jgi:hypothetical protein
MTRKAHSMLARKSFTSLVLLFSGTIMLLGCGANNRVVTAPSASLEAQSADSAPATLISRSVETTVPASKAAAEPSAPDVKEVSIAAAVQDVVRDGVAGRRVSVLIAKCSGVSRPGPSDLADAESKRSVENILFLNRNRVATRGYHMLTDIPPGAVENGDGPAGTPTAEDQQVARCANAWAVAMAGVTEPDYSPALAANVQMLTFASTTPDLANQRTAWTQCMAAGGFNVSVRGDSITTFLKSAEPTAAERTQALADYDCQGSSGLREGKRQWLANQTSGWLAKNRSWVDSLSPSHTAYEAKLAELERIGWRG